MTTCAAFRRFVPLLAALTLAAVPAVGRAAGPVHVTGGGTAAFDDPRFGGLTTDFGIGVAVHPDGSATGAFECIITGVLSLEVMADSGTVNGDGSVTFSGLGVVYFAGGGRFVDVFTVTANAGGPGVGTFCLAPPTFPDTDCDHETVVVGRIVIK